MLPLLIDYLVKLTAAHSDDNNNYDCINSKQSYSGDNGTNNNNK